VRKLPYFAISLLGDRLPNAFLSNIHAEDRRLGRSKTRAQNNAGRDKKFEHSHTLSRTPSEYLIWTYRTGRRVCRLSLEVKNQFNVNPIGSVTAAIHGRI